jgi:hypothetical protein
LVDGCLAEVILKEAQTALNELGYLMARDEGELNNLKYTRERTLLLILVTEST